MEQVSTSTDPAVSAAGTEWTCAGMLSLLARYCRDQSGHALVPVSSHWSCQYPGVGAVSAACRSTLTHSIAGYIGPRRPARTFLSDQGEEAIDTNAVIAGVPRPSGQQLQGCGRTGHRRNSRAGFPPKDDYPPAINALGVGL
jgi:hypothetical protein